MRLTTLDFRTALRVLTSEDVPPGEVVREGEEVVIRVAGDGARGPPPARGREAARGDPPRARAGRARSCASRVAPEVPFEASHEPGMLTVVFGEQPAPDLRGPVTPGALPQLFPTGAAAPGSGRGGDARRRRGGGGHRARPGRRCAPTSRRAGSTRTSWPSTTRPRSATSTCRWRRASPRPCRVWSGELAAEYEPRLRFFSDIPLVNETSHFAGAEARAAGRLPHPPAPRPPLHAGDPRDDGRGPGPRVLLRPLAVHLQRVERRRPRRPRGPALRRGGGGLPVDPLRRGAAGGLLRLRLAHAAGRSGLRCGERPEGHRELFLRADPALPGPRDRRVERAQPARDADRRDPPAHHGLPDGGLPQPDEPARHRGERVLPGAHPRRHAAPASSGARRLLDLQAQPRHRRPAPTTRTPTT